MTPRPWARGPAGAATPGPGPLDLPPTERKRGDGELVN